MVTIAKHHALGHAMIQECGGSEAFFKMFPNLDFEAFETPILLKTMNESFTSNISTNASIIEVSLISGNTKNIHIGHVDYDKMVLTNPEY